MQNHGPHGTSGCARGASYMLFMMRDIWSLNALPYRLCGIVTLLYLALQKVPCSCLCGSVTKGGGPLHHEL